MIAVIADDLSGAAELATAAAQLGFSAQVHTKFDPSARADVIAIDTNTRLLNPREDSRTVSDIALEVRHASPAWIYKKTDSVLRGDVRAEIESIRNAASLSRVLLIPANPSKNRIIKDGIYYVDGIPLSETPFSHDPHHPRLTSRVAELLELDQINHRLFVPDITSADDIAFHARDWDQSTLPAGGVDFFIALLKACAKPIMVPPSIPSFKNLRTLFICGSLTAWQSGRPAQCAAAGIPVLTLPSKMTGVSIDEWAVKTSEAISACGRAMIAIGDSPGSQDHRRLLLELTVMLPTIIGRAPIDQICVEGGETATSVIQRFRWKQFTALPDEFTLIPLPSGPILRIKPGSYPWPDSIFKSTAITS